MLDTGSLGDDISKHWPAQKSSHGRTGRRPSDRRGIQTSLRGDNNTALTFNKDGFYSDIFGVMIMSYDCFHAHMLNVVQLKPFSDHCLRI